MILRCTHITSTGVLKLLNRTSALVHLDFEEVIPLEKRQVVGMQHDDVKATLVGKRITIRGIESTQSLPNQGSFGRTFLLNRLFSYCLLYSSKPLLTLFQHDILIRII